MKKRNISWRNMKYGWIFLTSSFLFSACSDEYRNVEGEKTNQQLAFLTVTQELYEDNLKTATRSGMTTVEVDELKGVTTSAGEPLYLHTLTTDSIGLPKATSLDASRGVAITTATMYDRLGMFVFAYDGEWSSKGNMLSPYAYNVVAKKSSAKNIWQASAVHWKEGKKHAIFSYAPFAVSGATFSGESDKGTPILTYVVPSTVADQKDLLVSQKIDQTYSSTTSMTLTYKHALTAVTFSVGTEFIAGTIKSISLEGVYGKGEFDMFTQTWKSTSVPTTYTQSLNIGASTSTAAQAKSLTSGEATFMLLPQTLPNSAQLKVVYADSITYEERTLSVSLAGKVWEQGKTKTYSLTTKSFKIVPEFSAAITSDATVPYTGGTIDYEVISKATITEKDGSVREVQLPWTAQFSLDNGSTWISQPAWLETFTASGAGSIASAVAKIAAQVNTPNATTTILQNAKAVTNYNLSTAGGTKPRSTANCYIINAPGTYKVPLIYGNAYKNGVDNTSAYKTSATGSEVLMNFVNHDGVAIKSPWIKNNEYNNGTKIVPAKCTLIWQDADGLVTNVGIDGDCLTFEVPKATIQEGNAIVAVQDASGTILWSWHIWVTNYILGNDDVTVSNSTDAYTVMAHALGWVGEETKQSYAAREVLVRFVQTSTAKTAELTFIQTPYQIVGKTGNAVYYQWGRKDPMLPSIADVEANYVQNMKSKPFYTTNAQYGYKSVNGAVSIAEAIRNPYNFYVVEGNWTTTPYKNLWNANEVNYAQGNSGVFPQVKTVYDPSPVGYQVPPQKLYAILSGMSSTWESRSKVYHIGDKALAFYALAYREGKSGNTWQLGEVGTYWTTLATGSTNANYFLFFSYSANADASATSSFGHPIQPCKES